MGARPKHIYLCGFMGSGKTTLGQLLAEHIGWRFADTDEEIEKNTGRDIPDFFEQEGEAAFRKIEKALIRKMASQTDPAVIALGGGSLMDEDTLRIVKSTGRLIYLQCREEVLLQRIQGTARPLLKTKTFQDLMNHRIRGYEQADWTIRTDQHSPEDSVEKIIQWLMANGFFV